MSIICYIWCLKTGLCHTSYLILRGYTAASQLSQLTPVWFKSHFSFLKINWSLSDNTNMCLFQFNFYHCNEPGVELVHCWPKPSSVPVAIYECDLQLRMLVNNTRNAKVYMPNVIWHIQYVHHHNFPPRQRRVSNVLSLLDHQYPSTSREAST